MIGYLLIALISLVWLGLVLSKKAILAFAYVLVLTTLNLQQILPFDYEVVLKLLFFASCAALILKNGLKTRFVKYLFLFVGLFAVNLYFAQFDALYKMKDAITGAASVLIGFAALLVAFKRGQKRFLLKTLVFLPLISMGLGLLLWPFGLFNPFSRGGVLALSGASSSTNLAFFGFVGFASGLWLYSRSLKGEFVLLGFVDFLIVCGSLTRGAVLACLPLALIAVYPLIKSIFKSKNRVIGALIFLVLSLVPLGYVFSALASRTFSGSSINTSGRIEAWAYILSLCKNKLVGNGYGFLKTRTDFELRFFTAAHNEFIHMYLETGILGAIIFFGGFLLLVRRLFVNSRLVFEKACVVAVTLGFLIYSLFDNTLTNFHCWLPFMLLYSLVSTEKESILKINVYEGSQQIKKRTAVL